MTTSSSSPTPLDGVSQPSRLALPVILAGTFMVVLDFFILNVALPSMRHALHASATDLEWVVAGYALTSGVLLMAAGRLGARWGRRRAFSAGVALFTVSSAVCGCAPSPELLIVGRLVQGAGAAVVMPNVLALIGALYQGPDRARALSAYGMVMGLAAVGGQILGGLLVDGDVLDLGWRSCFLINLPIGVAALVLAPRAIPASREREGGSMDLAGTVGATVALALLVLPLIEGRRLHWPAWSIVSLGVVPLLLAGLIAHVRRQTRHGRPALFELELFASRTFSAGLAAQLLFWCGQASYFLVLALYLQNGRGLTPLAAGVVFTLVAGPYLASSLRAPQLTLRHGRRVLAAGAGLLAAGHLVLVATLAEIGTGGSVLELAPGLALAGAGMGLCITPLATLGLGAAGPDRVGSASELLATVQNVGNALGVAIIGLVFFGQLEHGYAVAFEWSGAVLCAVLLAVAAIARLLPESRAGAEAVSAAERPLAAERAAA